MQYTLRGAPRIALLRDASAWDFLPKMKPLDPTVLALEAYTNQQTDGFLGNIFDTLIQQEVRELIGKSATKQWYAVSGVSLGSKSIQKSKHPVLMREPHMNYYGQGALLHHHHLVP